MARFSLSAFLIFFSFSSLIYAGEAPPSTPSNSTSAKPSPKEPVKSEKRLVEKGIAYFKQGDFNRAQAHFRQAYAISNNYKMLFNIGQAELSFERYGLAREAFEQYLGAGQEKIPDSRVNEVNQYLHVLKKTVGALYLRAAPNCAIYINGMKRGETPYSRPIYLKSGMTHQLVLQYQGKVVYRKFIEAAPRQRIQLAALAETMHEIDKLTAQTDSVKQPAPSQPSTATAQPHPITKRHILTENHVLANKLLATRNQALSFAIGTVGFTIGGSALFFGEHSVGYAIGSLSVAGGLLAVSLASVVLHQKYKKRWLAVSLDKQLKRQAHRYALKQSIQRNRLLAIVYTGLFGALSVTAGSLLFMGGKERNNDLVGWGWGCAPAAGFSLVMALSHLVFMLKDRKTLRSKTLQVTSIHP